MPCKALADAGHALNLRTLVPDKERTFAGAGGHGGGRLCGVCGTGRGYNMFEIQPCPLKFLRLSGDGHSRFDRGRKHKGIICEYVHCGRKGSPGRRQRGRGPHCRCSRLLGQAAGISYGG